MPKAIICIKECGINSANQKAQLVFDVSTDYIVRDITPLTLGDQRMDVIITSSIQQLNGGIKQAVLDNLVANGFPNTGITLGDITIFGGAQ